MSKLARFGKWFAIAAAAVAVWGLFLVIERPAYLRWGATAEEVARVYPGQERVPNVEESSVRAVTIDAPPERVWPWVAQIGQDRAGFYSYEVLEDIVGGEMPNETRIVDAFQTWKPDDRLWMYPKRKLEGEGSAPLVAYEPGRHLVFAVKEMFAPREAEPRAIWGFGVEPAEGGRTRLIAWSRGAAPNGLGAVLLQYALLEPAHYVMERRMLLNIRALAEGRVPSVWEANVSVIVWTLTIALLLTALVLAMRRRDWPQPLMMAAAAALLFQFLTFGQPPAVVAAALFAALVAFGFRARMRVSRPAA